MSFPRAFCTMLHHRAVNSFILLHLVALRFEVFRGKKSPILEMPACADRGEHKVHSTSSLFFLVRHAHPEHQLPRQFRYPQAQVLTGDRLQRMNWAGWWWLCWASQMSPTPRPQYSGLIARMPQCHRRLSV